MLGITQKLPHPIRTSLQQAQSYLASPRIQQAKQYGTTMVAQQLSGKKDGVLMNTIQALSPQAYNVIRLTKGNVLHMPIAFLAQDRYLAYRMAKESESGVTLLKSLGILFAPKTTAAAQGIGLLTEGKLKVDAQALNPFN